MQQMQIKKTKQVRKNALKKQPKNSKGCKGKMQVEQMEKREAIIEIGSDLVDIINSRVLR